MAYTQLAQYSFSMLDELGTRASEVFYCLLDPTKTVADIVADWTTLEALVQLCTGAGIQRGDIKLLLVPDPIGSAASGSRVEQTGVINFLNATTPHRFAELIPALLNSKIVSQKLNLADTDISNLTTALTTPTANTEYCTNDARPLTAVADGFVSFRKRRRQLDRSSFETP